MTFQPAKSFQKETWRPHSPLVEEDGLTFLLLCLALWRNHLHTESLQQVLRHATRNWQAIVSHVRRKEENQAMPLSLGLAGRPCSLTAQARACLPFSPCS